MFLHDNIHLMKFVMQIDIHGSYVSACASDLLKLALNDLSVWIAANKLEVDAIFVYTRRGYMASLLSRCRPDCPIFAFTDTKSVRQRLNLQWGLIPFRLDFSGDMESNLRRTFALLKARGMMKTGDLVVAVSDISEADMLQSIQVRRIPWGHYHLWLQSNIEFTLI